MKTSYLIKLTGIIMLSAGLMFLPDFIRNSPRETFHSGHSVYAQADQPRILYHNTGCEHCVDLLKDMNENNLDKILNIEYRDSDLNADKYMADYEFCYPQSQVRTVPFMIYDGECLSGSAAIREFIDDTLGETILTADNDDDTVRAVEENSVDEDSSQKQDTDQDSNIPSDTADNTADLAEIGTFDVVLILSAVAFFAIFAYVLLFKFEL